ncbi:MAG: ferritin-like domain-containing protein [Vicinamibacterales bacterium]|jgi:hypothetical protein
MIAKELHFRERPLPPKPEGVAWRDYLILLLHIAAELEQSLMVQYLYAAYSLGGKHAAEQERKVHEWRDAILTVAKEEMGHLLTVQNCLCLLGGPISFEREDYPWDTPYYPFEFCLEPLTLRSLAKYVFAEMPATFTEDDKLEYGAAKAARKLLGPRARTPVGEIYDKIIEIISDPSKIPDADFNAETYGIQASFDDWGRGYRPGPFAPHVVPTDAPPPNQRKTRLIIAQMASRTEAIAALTDVAGQGEAPHLKAQVKAEPSHFARFARIFRELEAIQETQKDWSPSRRVPVNPVVANSADVNKESTAITAEPSRTWAALFNIRYRMLLTYLTHTFQLRRDNLDGPDDRRAAVMSKVFGEMYNLKAIAGILVRLPLVSAGDPRRAGPTFQTPFTLVLPSSEADVWRLQRDLVRGSQDLVATLMDPKQKNHHVVPADGPQYLAALRDLDLQSMAFIDQVLIGLRPAAQRTRK